jgi:hypothetical protein
VRNANDSDQSAIIVTKGLTIMKGPKPLSVPDQCAGMLAVDGGTCQAIASNSVAGYGFASNWVAVYAFASMWDAGYGIVSQSPANRCRRPKLRLRLIF